MTTLLETIKKHDAKMEALTRKNDRLEQALMFLVDDLIDRDLTLCVDSISLGDAVRMLRNRGLMDSTRNKIYDDVREGLCDQSVKLMKAIRVLGESV